MSLPSALNVLWVSRVLSLLVIKIDPGSILSICLYVFLITAQIPGSILVCVWGYISTCLLSYVRFTFFFLSNWHSSLDGFFLKGALCNCGKKSDFIFLLLFLPI